MALLDIEQIDLLDSLHAALKSNDEKRLREELETCNLSTLQDCMQADHTVFVSACARGFLSAAVYLHQNCFVNLNAELEGRTALQWACLRGHQFIVEMLLSLPELSLQTQAWQENSEFFSASLGGRMDIIHLLTEHFPDAVNDTAIMQALLYAACLGGHLPMVRRWLLPSMDINQPVQLVSTLHDCEHRTPLHAACKGNHREVALLLITDLGAEIKEFTAKQFPEFTASLVACIFHPLQITDTEVMYNLSSNNICTIHPVWIKPHLSDITLMNLSNNKLRQLDACIPWAMLNLKHLDVSHNQLSKLQSPEQVEDIICHRLESINASHNRLTEVSVELCHLQALTNLNLSHNSLQRLRKIFSPTTSTGQARPPSSLATLNLSNNVLDLLPMDIRYLSALTSLDLSYNKLCALPSPWNCDLVYLDVSYNQLERFPPCTDQFWSGSLMEMYLDHNNFDLLDESILKLGMLQKLNAAHNKIQFLPPPHVWKCSSLVELNLSYNCLGNIQRAQNIEFPFEVLSNELRSLNLSNNSLLHLPLSVCFIKNLASLDISNNPIRDLPKELGHLRECWELKLSDCSLQKTDLLSVIKKGKSVIKHMRKQLRSVQPCHIIKVLIVGPQGKGKSTVIESLVRGRVDQVKLSDQQVTVTTAVLKKPGNSFRLKERKDAPDVTLRIWELAGEQDLLAFHPVMWSENSLFLLVWDMTDTTSGLCQWLCNIKSRLARVGVIIVATFRDRIQTSEEDSKVHNFHAEINKLYLGCENEVYLYPKEDKRKIFPHLCGVVFVTREMLKSDIIKLRSTVYTSVLTLVRVVHSVKFVVGQQLPQSYLSLDRELVKMAEKLKETSRPPFITQEEFDELVRTVPGADFDIFDDRQQALKVCSQMGSVLHFDVWSEGLRHLYFLNPNWLAKMVAAVLNPPGVSAPHKQPVDDVLLRLSSLEFPSNIFEPFRELLKHFDIGVVQQSNLLLPCRLPKAAPGLQISPSKHSRSLLRFYAMPYVPSRLWSRLILGLLMSVDRFSQSFGQDLKMENPQRMYWQEGLNIKYSGGSIVIESAMFVSTENNSKNPGILISILTDSPTLRDLAVIGFVTDEIDSSLQNIFAHYNDNTDLFGAYALCPVCFQVRPCEGIIEGKKLHFPVSDCAGDLLLDQFAHCERGNKVALEDLVPEFLMGELPERVRLQVEDLELKETLGVGGTANVLKGVLKGKEVAVKVFYMNSLTQIQQPEDMVSSDSGLSTVSSTESQDSTMGRSRQPPEYGNFKQVSEEMRMQDRVDGRNLKVSKAFSELRQEVVILSQLQHPCLISLLGVTVRPSLLLVLELAPFGSLRHVLDELMKYRPFNRHHYKDKDKIFTTVLNKDITFKIVYQVAVGLEYLHKHNIVYRDLKSDNILVCSKDTADTVNIKISDYGISKFVTSQGAMGMVGTPGYIAPEIMDGQAYNAKVDIFSFSMVIYELLTGHPPFETCKRLHQIHQLVNLEKRRPSLKEYNVISNFPYLENMMENMWEHDPHLRPSAAVIMRSMENAAFVLQQSHLAPMDLTAQGRSSVLSGSLDIGFFCSVTCAWASKEINSVASITGRNNCWVWESPTSDEKDRRLSIYNLADGKLQAPISKNCPGQPVTCMAKVGSLMWVGVKGGNLEIYGCSCTELTKGRFQFNDLGSDPVAIIHDKHNPNKEKFETDEGVVYVGLMDGTIQIFLHRRKNRRATDQEWSRHKKLIVSSSPTLQTMCFLPTRKELVVGCDHSLIIISTNTLLVEKKLCLVKNVPASVRNHAGLLHALTANEDTLWCSFVKSPLIVELDVVTWKVCGAYFLQADLEVYISEVKLETQTNNEEVCRLCDGMSAIVSGPIGPMETEQDLSKPPRPPRFIRPQPALAENPSSIQDSAPQHTLVESEREGTSLIERSSNEVPGPQRNHSSSSSSDYTSSSRSRSSTTSSEQSSSSTPESDFSDLAEELPFRRSLSGYPMRSDSPTDVNKYRSQTLPNSCGQNIPPPQLPPRRSLPSGYNGIYVETLLCVKDTLWVGTSCGEILVIGVQDRKSLPQSQVDKGEGTSASNVQKTQPGSINFRMSLNLAAKQMCNLQSVKMITDGEKSDEQRKTKSGAVRMLIQACDLVVAVRRLTQEEADEDVAEVAIWEACSAERIASIRHHWQSLQTLTKSSSMNQRNQ